MKSNRNRGRSTGINKKDDNIIISSEYFEDTRPSFICSICKQTSRLTDAGQNNTTFWCRNCSVEFDPESENIRRESKISVPDRNQETLVATTPGQDYLNKSVEINHTPEPKGTFKVLQQKGIRIKDYHTTEKE